MPTTKLMTKKQLAIDYEMDRKLLGYYMNTHFFDELEKVGYKKNMRNLPPIVADRFIELWDPSKKKTTI